ncbi:surface-adhesin E family protein [Pasteurella bettyae]|uniref:surface-adhesin E family protein n=1 Tax=Pasteurella bettyae TaxID=752 RepID=UPI003D2AC7E2
MKKLILLSMMTMMIVACSAPVDEKPLPTKPLQPPALVRPGFVRMSPDSQYYADINSVWVDTKKKHMIHFDAVINLTQGPYLYQDKTQFARSMRQAKIINCETMRLTHLNTDYYSEFWGVGERVSLPHQRKNTVNLRSGSSLNTLAQVLCTNLFKY